MREITFCLTNFSCLCLCEYEDKLTFTTWVGGRKDHWDSQYFSEKLFSWQILEIFSVDIRGEVFYHQSFRSSNEMLLKNSREAFIRVSRNNLKETPWTAVSRFLIFTSKTKVEKRFLHLISLDCFHWHVFSRIKTDS